MVSGDERQVWQPDAGERDVAPSRRQRMITSETHQVRTSASTAGDASATIPKVHCGLVLESMDDACQSARQQGRMT